MNINNLDALFWPKSVALIGASQKELSIGNVITKNLQRFGYKGHIYPVNPKASEIRGIKSYPTIFEIPGEVDLAHIVIPPPFVPDAVEECGKKGVKAIIINTAGFKEMGEEGAALEKDFLQRAEKYGVRIFGPNCQGIINTDPSLKAYCDFTFTYPEPGYISIVAQSGGVGAIIMQNFFDVGIGMRMYASNGNASDVSITDIIKYWGDDEGTRVIVLYVESLSNPKEFLQVAGEVTAKKPILAMRAGSTEQGAKAAASHTGGLSGGIATDLIFKKAGILPFKDAAELCQAAVAFSSQPIPKGKNVGMITNTGGPAIIATDELSMAGLNIPPLSEKALAVLNETMFPAASINNPLDVVATAGAPQFRSAIDVMMAEEHIDSVYINFVTAPFVDCESVARELAEVNNMSKKPIVCNYMTDKSQWTATTKILTDSGIPCYDFPGTAARALASLTAYSKLRSRKKGQVTIFNNVDRVKVRRILHNANEAGRSLLTSYQVYSILEAYNIPVAPWAVSKNEEEAVAAASVIKYPVVLKADSEKINHKSDMGGVVVNIKNTAELRDAMTLMKKKIAMDDLRFFIQKFTPGGTELIIGANRKDGLGHLIMFGIGGIYVEVLKDVTFSLTPVTEFEAKEMLASIKAAAILDGVRGKKGINKAITVEIILRLSQLMVEFPEIKELDMNPLMAFEDKIIAVDGRISISACLQSPPK